MLEVCACSTIIPYRRFNLLAVRLRGNYKENKIVECITNKRSIVGTLRGVRPGNDAFADAELWKSLMRLKREKGVNPS